MRLTDSPLSGRGHAPKPGIALDFTGLDESVTALSPESIAKARRAVASRAIDATDARLLMEHLGLLAPHTPSPTWRRNNTPKAAS